MLHLHPKSRNLTAVSFAVLVHPYEANQEYWYQLLYREYWYLFLLELEHTPEVLQKPVEFTEQHDFVLELVDFVFMFQK